MSIYIVRPYYGYDCDSDSGFNNGHYLDDIEIEAESEDAAVAKAFDQFESSSDWERDGSFGDFTLYVEFDHIWRDDDGNEYSSESDLPIDPDTDAPVDAEVSYLYKYIDFNNVELKGAK